MLRHLKLALTTWLLVAPLGLGCTEQPAAGADEVVTAFFDAVFRNDCDEARRWLAGSAKERFESEPCADALEILREKQFERILSVRADGRDDQLQLVRARFAAEREPVVIGVRKTRRGNRIVSF